MSVLGKIIRLAGRKEDSCYLNLDTYPGYQNRVTGV